MPGVLGKRWLLRRNRNDGKSLLPEGLLLGARHVHLAGAVLKILDELRDDGKWLH